jgi:hypothetical protein
MHGEFLRLIFLQAHRETTAHSTAIGIAYSFSSVEQVFDTRCVVTTTQNIHDTREKTQLDKLCALNHTASVETVGDILLRIQSYRALMHQ